MVSAISSSEFLQRPENISHIAINRKSNLSRCPLTWMIAHPPRASPLVYPPGSCCTGTDTKSSSQAPLLELLRVMHALRNAGGGIDRSLQSPIAKPRMVGWPRPQRPVKQPLGRTNWQIIDRRIARIHESFGVELPIFIAIRSRPLPRIIAPFIRKPDSNPRSVKRP